MERKLTIPSPAAQGQDHLDARLVGTACELTAGHVPPLLNAALPVGHEEGVAEMGIQPEVDVAWLAEQIAHENFVFISLFRGRKRRTGCGKNGQHRRGE